MTPLAIAGILLSAVSSLLTFAFFLGFYFGTFKEFKKTTEESIARLMSVYFTEEKQPRFPPVRSRHSRARTAGPDSDYEN
jgi:hypothetical protein